MGKTKIVLQVKIREKTHTFQLSEYFRRNWGSPFLIMFMLLLLMAAGYLSIGLEKTANLLAEYAYYNLLIGVLLQLRCYFKQEETCRK